MSKQQTKGLAFQVTHLITALFEMLAQSLILIFKGIGSGLDKLDQHQYDASKKQTIERLCSIEGHVEKDAITLEHLPEYIDSLGGIHELHRGASQLSRKVLKKLGKGVSLDRKVEIVTCTSPMLGLSVVSVLMPSRGLKEANIVVNGARVATTNREIIITSSNKDFCHPQQHLADYEQAALKLVSK